MQEISPMDSENLQNKDQESMLVLWGHCLQPCGLLFSNIVNLHCRINGRNRDSSEILYEEDCLHGTAELMEETERVTMLLLGAKIAGVHGDICKEDIGRTGTKYWN